MGRFALKKMEREMARAIVLTRLGEVDFWPIHISSVVSLRDVLHMKLIPRLKLME